MAIRTVIDRGPKGKRVVAFALDWPGWSRGAKTDEEALATLEVTKRMRKTTLAFLIRHSAFHTLDHAWEMEDKDLS